MKSLFVLAVAVLAVAVPAAATASHPKERAVAAVVPPQTESDQHAFFYGRTPFGQYQIRFYAYHYEGDPAPYVLGGTWWANGVGVVKAWVATQDLASNYGPAAGGEGPVYEAKACIDPAPLDAQTVTCTPLSYVGYYPESMWFYTGH